MSPDGVVRNALLVGSENAWLRRHLSNLRFVRRAVGRFMPGERLEDALAAATELQRLGIGAVLTRLGENITDVAAAEATTRHYVAVTAEVGARSLDCHISVKLTQLGIDVDEGCCRANLFTLVKETQRRNVTLWIDMAQS